ncbi:MAG: HDIG domain-containing protein [Clostridia bacterium]|nr:HDIG domain-containing protein [Clostridia bacterium]
MTIINFAVHTIVMCALALGIIFINSGTPSAFVEYFSVWDNVRNYVYLSLFISILNVVTYLYLYCESRDFLMEAKNITLVFLVIDISLALSFVMGNYVGVYARPIALCALLILLLINKRTALFINFSFAFTMFVVDVFTNQPFDTIRAASSAIMAGTIGIIAVYLIDGIGSRIKVFGRGLVISFPIALFAAAMEFTALDGYTELLFAMLHSLTGGLLSVVAMMAILPVFEWMFNILTNYRLAEIIDHKSKLIRKMIEEAPGTFNHSMVVASLAETCAAAIGENPILARAAAYYHDIGKLKQPLYFTENQHGHNPHDDLTPELSTEIIRSHTRDGYELIKKYHLPLILADVAREHHGTLPIQFFYLKALKYTEGGELDITNFCYPGPKPHSKIAAIIMLSDGCEAAVRSNNDRSRERVEKIVSSIFEDRVKKEQFSDCDITMHEIDLVKEAVINGLSGVYHDRIDYSKIGKRGANAFIADSGNEPK